MKAPTIITPVSCELDTYGHLNVTDTLGNITRINQKHAKLHPLFTENTGKAVKLIWATYLNKDYVDDAELFDGVVPEQVATPKARNVAQTTESKSRAFALSYAKDLVVAGKIEPDKIFSYATAFEWFLDGKVETIDEEALKILLGKHFQVNTGKE